MVKKKEIQKQKGEKKVTAPMRVWRQWLQKQSHAVG